MGDYNTFLDEVAEELSHLAFSPAVPPPPTKISVIIPAYNTETYIAQCLLSLVKQTFREIEILVVDDGSTDNTRSIVKTFIQHDKRIKLITQENQGAGIAKNNALNQATGEFVAFVDSDDFLEKDALETAFNTCLKNNVDLVVFGANGILENKKCKCLYGIEKVPQKFKNQICQPAEIQKNLFNIPVIAMCKLYNREFLIKNNIYFQDTKTGEDQIFFIKSMLLAKSAYILSKNIYNYRRKRKGSLTFTKKKKDNSVIYNFYAIEDFIHNCDIPNCTKDKILNKYFSKCVSWLGKCEAGYREKYFEDLTKLCNFVAKNYPQIFNNEFNLNSNDSYFILKTKLFYLEIRRRFNDRK